MNIAGSQVVQAACAGLHITKDCLIPLSYWGQSNIAA
jgi:hypothetical protein